MSDWIKAINPTSAITTEAEAERAARASALSIFIGVAVGLASLAWTLANPAALQDAAATAALGDAEAAAAGAAMATQAAIWGGAAMIAIQLIFGIVQWRSPGKFIAILFMALIALGLVSTAMTPLLASALPNAPATPVWQIALSVAIMAVQLVLHAAGLRGISRLDRMQMEQAR